jgi:hypothetical protein
MDRQKALKVTKALNELEGYEIFVDNLTDCLEEAKDLCSFPKEFIESLNDLLDYEQKRREKVLEDL